MKSNPVVHFEMPYSDAARVKKFYEEAFGWGMQQLGEEMGGYVMAHASETDEHNMVKNPGNINGGFFPAHEGATMPNVVIAVEDIAAAIENVKAAGGTLLNGPTEIPGIGMYANIRDTEGNRVSLLQPKRA
jgi:predicted enzyme related to lactoylglutathione lyase